MRLTRLNRPIGIYLLLWPTLVALWFAADGVPSLGNLLIFIVGTILTRSAGCAINDYADRHIDGRVSRTRERPLATGELTPKDALLATGLLMLLAFVLVLFTNALTITLSFGALLLAVLYPFSKRVTDFPQVVLGAAFGFAIPMAFAAETGTLPAVAWVLYLSAISWAVAYDTFYAMADRDDDVKLGVRSTAIRFGQHELALVAAMYVISFAALALAGIMSSRGLLWYASLALASWLATREWRRARSRKADDCFQAFLANHRIGACIFIGVLADTALGSLISSA